jgi:Domain of unknown function (DUF5667)
MSVRDRDDLVVARLHELAPHLDGEPDPAWQARTRARLVAMAAVRSSEPAPGSPIRRLLSRAEDAAPSRWRARLTAGLAGAAMAVTALATLVAVSTGAGPGDPLYGLKRGTEQTQLALAGDARGQTLLDLARTRLHELEELTGSGVSALPAAGGAGPDGTVVLAAATDPRLVLETLATMDAQTTDGAAWLTERAVGTGDDAPLDLLAAWTQDQSEGLAALRDAVPAATVDELDGSLDRLSQISARTVGVQDVLDCPAGVPVESTDQFGPLPGLCLPDGQQTPPVAGGEEDPGSVPAPNEGPGATTTTPPAAPSAGGPKPSGAGESPGGTGVPSAPAPEVPGGGGLPSVPVPTLPLPSISVGVPGSAPSAGSSTGSGSVPSLPLGVEVCLGPIQVNCPD